MMNSDFTKTRTSTDETTISTNTNYMRVDEPNYVEAEYTITCTDKEDYEYYPEFEIDREEIREREHFRRNPIPIPVLHKQQPRFNRQILPCNNYN